MRNIAGTDGAMVWDAKTGSCQAILQDNNAGMRWVAVASGGCLLLTAFADSMIKKWDLDTCTCLQTLPGALALEYK